LIKLFGHPASTYTRKVLCTLHEVAVPFDLHFVDLIDGEHTRAAHLARQPFGRVPTMEDEGFTLYESRAIIRYLNDQYGGRLVPSDVKGRALMDQWIDVEYSYFADAALKPILHDVFEIAQDEATLASAGATIERTLDVLDARLRDEPYLAGEQFSLADIVYLPDLDYLKATTLHAAVSYRDNVVSWLARISARASWCKVTSNGLAGTGTAPQVEAELGV
jgi:glutathione S-transferase